MSAKAIRWLVAVLGVAMLAGQQQLLPAHAASNYAPVVQSDNPSGYWRLGEASGTSAADASGKSNPLTYQGGGTLGVSGAITGDSDTAFGGNGSTAVATTNKAIGTATTNFSLEAWIKPTTLPQLGMVVYDGIKDTSQGGYGFAIASTTFTSGSELVGVLGNVATIDSGYSFPSPNQWYHVVMTRDTSTLRFYVNGKQTSASSTTSPTAPGARFSLAGGVNSAGTGVNGFSGSVDEVAVYPSALSAGRITAHYQEGSAVIGSWGSWAKQAPTTSPSARWLTQMAYDQSHQQVVMFGGLTSGGPLADTWTWSGGAWTQKTPSTTPSARSGAMMAYDSLHSQTVLFGGVNGSTYDNDTWVWNGTTWTKLTPATSPPVRTEAAMAYNTATNTTLLFGGYNGSSYLSDTWSWNGTTWTQLTPSTSPSGRVGPGAAYQASNSQVVIFGGYNGSSYLSDTWTWNGTTWTAVTPTAAPSGRRDPSLAYDPITQKTVLFGGRSSSSHLGDTWTWDGTTWALQNTSTAPVVRDASGQAYDGATGTVMLFGGYDGTTAYNDTWYWQTPPDVATGVSATGGNAQATVTWTAPATNGGSAVTGYKVLSSPGGLTATTTGATSATVTGLTNGTAYTFTVKASNAIGTGAPSASSTAVTPSTVPGAPTATTATAGNTQATVNWTAPASNGGSAITSYKVTSAPGGLTATTTGATSATVTGLTNGTAYTFTVVASNTNGAGASSGASNSVTPGTVPGAPTGVTPTAGNAQATVSWTAPASNGGSAITSYKVTSSPGGLTATTSGATTATVTGLTNGTAYTFTVTATNGFGTGPASTASNSVTPAAPTAPGAPTSVVATAGNAQATVTWSAPASNGGSAITGYKVTASPGGLNATTTGATSATVTGLTNGTSYTFTVTANNSVGTGPASVASNAVTPQPPQTVPGAPTNVVATPGNAQASVTWNAPASTGGSTITGYKVTSSPGGLTATTTGATTATVTGLTNGTSYTFSVTATNSVGTGPASTASNSVTPAAPLVCGTGWTCQDIGSPTPAGAAGLSGGVWTVQGGGSDITGTTDQFQFDSQPVSGGVSISTKVTSQTATDPWAKAGLMVRATNDPASPYYAVFVTPSNGLAVQSRLSQGGGTNSVFTAGAVPLYLQITEQGTTLAAYTSPDGVTWTLVPGSSLNMANLTGTLLAGLAVTSHNTGLLSTVSFSAVSVGAAPCPTGWTCQDIGGAYPPGVELVNLGAWTVQGGGADINGTSDQFHFESQPMTGGGSISTKVNSQTATDPWAKAGLMIRASNNPGSPYYAFFVTPSNGLAVQYRSTLGGGTSNISASGATPTYLEITQQGTTFSAYSSPDGATWTLLQGSATSIPSLTGTLMAGLAVTSHSGTLLSAASFSSVSLGPPPCPTGWTCQDIGSPALSGSESVRGGTWTVQGSGADITGTSDQFQFESQPMSGGGSISTKVLSQTATDPWAKAGLMVRASNDPGSPYYAIFVTPSNGVTAQSRLVQGGATSDVVASGTAPVYLKISESETTFTAYSSPDGVTWTAIAGFTQSIPSLSGTLLAGLAVTSHNATLLSTVGFSSVVLSPPLCPSGWTCQDIGAPTPIGSEAVAGGTWTVQGGGNDIWGGSDQFQFESHAVPGNGTVSARVVSQGNTNSWAKAGLMVRLSNDPGSPEYSVFVTPGNGLAVQYRAVQGGASVDADVMAATLPEYVEISRVANTFTAYSSPDGLTWTAVPNSSLSLPNLTGTLMAGMAVTSHNSGALSTVPFDTVGFSANAPAPVVSNVVATVSGGTSATITWNTDTLADSKVAYGLTNAYGSSTTYDPTLVTSHSQTISGLTSNTVYHFKVLSSDALGQPAITVDQTFNSNGSSGAPTAVSATAGDGQATVTWGPAPTNGGGPITGYTVTSNPGGFSQSLSASATTATFLGLVNGVAYQFTVTSANSGGPGGSATSPAVVPAGRPAAPTAVTASAGNGQVVLNWAAPSNNGSAITSYTTTASPGGQSTTVSGAPPAATVTVTGLTNGVNYTFTVTATNAVGTGLASSPSNEATPVSVPGPPTNVAATAGNAQAMVSWSAPGATGGLPITGYNVTSSPGGVTVSTTATSAMVSGLTNGTTYTFTVTATNALGTGPASARSNTVIPLSVPGPPTAVKGSPGNGQATLQWAAPASGGGSPITGYTVTSSPGSLTATTTGATTATVAGLTNGTVYTFTVTATNGVGTGLPSAPSNTVIPAGAPTAPTGVTALVGNGQATVSWTAPATDGGAPILAYAVLATDSVNSAGNAITTLSPSSLSATVPVLINGDSYTFTVTATNALGTGPSSPPSNVVTPMGPPGPPTGVTATPGTGQATVSWTAPASNGGSSITGYLVRTYDGRGNLAASSQPGLVTSTTITGLIAGVSYTTHVAALNSAGTGSDGLSGTFAPTAAASSPAAPTNVTATAANGQATVAWTGPSNQGVPALTGYVITASPGGVQVHPGATATSYIVAGLTNGTSYSFAVAGINSHGTGVAATSNSVVPNTTTVPGQPGDVEATPGTNQAAITWQAPAAGSVATISYLVTALRGGTVQNQIGVDGNTTMATITGLPNGPSYTFVVVARSISGGAGLGTISTPSLGVVIPGATSTYASTILGTVPAPDLYYRLGLPQWNVIPSSGIIAADSSGTGSPTANGKNANNGSYFGSVGPTPGGLATDPTAGASQLGGGYVKFKAGSGLPVGSAARTFELWYQAFYGGGTLFSYGTVASGQYFEVALDPNVNGFDLTVDGSTTQVLNVQPAVTGAVWHHLAVTYDGNLAVTFYLDGVPIGTLTQGSALVTTLNSTNGLYIARSEISTTNLNQFDGGLEEFAVYPGRLSAAQIQTHYLAAGNGPPPAPLGVSAIAGDHSATISWQAVPENANNAITNYRVSAILAGRPENTKVVAGTATSAVITGLVPGGSYIFEVEAINGYGGGRWSNGAAASPTGTGQPYTAAVYTNRPSLYYRLDELAAGPVADSSGLYRDAYQGDTYYSSAPGALNNDPDTATVFGGYGVVQYLGGSGLPLGNSARSLETWFQTTASIQQTLITYGSSGSSAQTFALGISDPTHITFTGGSDDASFQLPYSVVNGAWHHVVLAYDGAQHLSLYLDGGAVGIQTLALPLSTNVGPYGLNIAQGFTGSMDEVAIYPTALNLADARAHLAAAGGLAPTVPAVIGGTPGNGQVTVALSAPVSDGGGDITSYTVSASPGSAQITVTGDPAPLSATLGGLTNGTCYGFQVTATNALGLSSPVSALSSPCITPATYADPPSGVSAVPGHEQATVQWTAPANNGGSAITGYTITSIPGGLVANAGAGATSVTLKGLTDGVCYVFTVATVNGVGTGATSTPSSPCITPVPASGAPTNVGATAGDSQATVTWGAAPTNGGGAITGYTVVVGPGGQTATVSGTATSAVITGLINGITYNFSVTSSNSGGPGGSSTSPQVTVSAPPGAPTGVTAVAGSGQALVTWQAPPANGSAISSYTLTATPGGATMVVAGSPPATSAAFAGLTNGTGYTFTITATNGSGTGPASVSSNSVAPSSAAPPTNVVATAGLASATVTWTAPVGVSPTSYTVTPYVGGGAQDPITGLAPTQTSYTITGLGVGTLDSFTIQAVTASGAGPVSALSNSVTPSSDQPAGQTGFDKYLYLTGTGNPDEADYGYTISSRGEIPAMATWTVEWDMWDINVTDFVGRCYRVKVGPVGFDYSPGCPLGGTDSIWDWPGGSAPVGGQPWGDSRLGPSHIAIDYDGVYVRVYVNGQEVVRQASASAQMPASNASIFDRAALISGAFREFRVSNLARYTSDSGLSVPTQKFPNSDPNTMLLWHFDNYPISEVPGVDMVIGSSGTHFSAWPDSSGHANDGAVSYYGGGCPIICISADHWLEQPYELGPGVGPNELPAGGSPWICPCTRPQPSYPVNTATGEFYHTFDDLSIPGADVPLDFSRSYSSVVATTESAPGPMGWGWTDSYQMGLTFDSNGNATLLAGNGSTVVFSSSGGVYTPPVGVLASLKAGGGSAFPTGYTFTDKSQTAYVFDSTGKLRTLTDRNHKTTTLSYPAGGIVVTDSVGRTLTITFNAQGMIGSVTDQGSSGPGPAVASRSVSFFYDATGGPGNGNLLSVTDVLNQTTKFGYSDSNNPHLMTTMQDSNCVATSGCNGVVNVYNPDHTIAQQTDYVGRVLNFSYSTSGPVSQTTTTVTDPNPNATVKTEVTVDTYLNDVLVSTVSAAGTAQQLTTTHQFSAATLSSLTSVVQPTVRQSDGTRVLGQPTSMDTVQRDPQANVLVETDELGRTTQATAYNAFNEPLATIDASGVETTKSYDGSGNVLSTCQPLVASGVTYSVAAPIKCGDPNSTSATTSYVYNDPAHPAEPTSMTDADGKVWTYQYDTYGDVNYSADPLGNVTTSIYDIDGRKRSEVAPKGNLAACACSAQYTTSWTYFPDNQVHTVTDPLNDVTTSTYDLDGNLYQSADALNPAKTTTYRYNLDSEPIESDRNDGSWQKTGYDGFGNVTGQTSGAAGSSTALTSMSYGYDALNRKVSEQAGTDGLTTSAYDPNTGLLTTMTSPKGVVTTYGYDAGSQLTSLSYSDGTTPNVGYTYDVLGRRQTMTDGTGTSTWSYDSLGRLVSYQNGAGVTVAYHYDLKGQQTSMLYPGQTTAVVTGYDAAGRVSTITDWLGHKTTYNYHDADVANPTTATVPQIEKDLPNGEVEMTTLDQAGRVREIKDTGGSTVNSDLTYSQDADGQLTQARSPISGPTTYGYDAVNRLGSAGSATYSYDAANEITGMVNGTTTTTFGNAGAYQSGGDGELPSRKVVNGSTVLQNVTYSYDLNGNRIGSSDSVSGNASTLTWDAANRLTSYASGPTSATYTYDGDGLRQSKTVGGVTSHETWDVSAGLPLLLSDGTYSYVNGPDGLALEEITGTTVNYLHHDQQGSTVLITGGTATEQARYTYDAYGNLLTNDNPSLVNNILYDGQYQDSESGMLYLRARYYDPAIAQFISRDPAVAQTREPYGYVRDSPLNESDPTGECAPWCVVVIILIISAGVGLQVCGDNLSGCGGNHSEHPEPSPTPGPSPTPSPSASPCSVHVPYACPRVPPPASPAGCNPHTTCLYPAPSPSPSVNEPRPPDPANDPGNSDQIPKPPDPNRDREGDVQMGCDPRASSLF